MDRAYILGYVSIKCYLFMDRSFILQQVSVKIALFIDRVYILGYVSINGTFLWTEASFYNKYP